MRFSFEVPGKPVPQGSMRSLGPRRMIHSNQAALMPWRDSVGWHAKNRMPDGWSGDGPIGIRATFRLPRPKAHYRADGTVKPAAPWWPTKRGLDIDKAIRALLDALDIAGVYGDDSQVVHLTADKEYGPPGLWCAVERLTQRNGEMSK